MSQSTGDSSDGPQTVDKKALLDELKIDRNAAPERSGGALRWLGVVGILVITVAVLWVIDLPVGGADAIPVKTAMARAGATQVGGASVLDATGYVVARRQATVSSKATGKVVEVLIEEGILVSQGQLLARLDDSIPRAQFELARSQL